MKKNWVMKKLGEICDIGAGNYAPQKKELFEKVIYPFFRTSDIGKIRFGCIEVSADRLNDNGIKKLHLYKKGTILFPKSGASTFLNHRVLMNTDGYVSSHLATLKANNDILDDRYLLYFLLTVDSRNLMQDQNYPSLRLSDIKEINIVLPMLPEQQRIVSILDDAFTAIARAKENAEKNLQNAREIFNTYLQFIFGNPGDAWEEKTIEKCFKVRSGDFLPAREMKKDGEFYVYGGNGIAGKHDKYNLAGDNIIIGRVGAKCGNVRLIKDKVWVTDNAFYISEYIETFNLQFLEYLLNLRELRNTANQAAQPVISYTTIKDIKLAIPPVSEQLDIVIKLDAVSTETKKLESIYQTKLANLDELKKSILHKAFNGELSGAN